MLWPVSLIRILTNKKYFVISKNFIFYKALLKKSDTIAILYSFCLSYNDLYNYTFFFYKGTRSFDLDILKSVAEKSFK